MRYYHARIAADPSDVSAYAALGRLEEQSGYYTSALRRLTIARALGSQDAEVSGPMGRALMRLARFEEAKSELEKAARAAPDDVEAVANLAGWYHDDGRPAEAIRRLEAFVARHPNLADPRLPAPRADVERLMLCFAEAGDGAMTRRMAEHIIRLAPDAPNGYAIAGRELLAEQRPREALERLRRALELAPGQATLHFYCGLALAGSGPRPAAFSEWLKTITLDREQTVAYYYIGGEYARRRQWRFAGTAYAQAALLNSNDSRACRLAALMFQRAGSTMDAAYWFSIAAGNAGDYKAELRYALQVLSDPGPQSRRIGLRGVADAYRGMQKPGEFLHAMVRLATRDTYNDNMMLAEAYADLEDFVRQKIYLNRALARAPDRAGEVHYLLGMTAKKLGQMDLAEQELTRATRAAPDNVGYHRELADQCFARRDVGDRLQRALQEYRWIVQHNPGASVDWQHLGVACSAAGDQRRAVNCLEHAIDLQPGNGPCYQELGRVYAQIGDLASSRAMLALYRRYVSFTEIQQTLITRAGTGRKNPTAQVALADFLVRAGDYDNAAQRYALALQLHPDDASTRRKLARIYGLTGRPDLQFELEHPVPRAETEFGETGK
jgi:tetratricopeptide (TPR) repeat protein